MNKIVLVVEGTSDVNRLKNLIDADFVITNGSAVSDKTIEYIKELVKTREVVVLTDPDFPGTQIRNKIANAVPEVKHAFVDRSKASNGKKLGVCETQKEEILHALANYVNLDVNNVGSLTSIDMFTLGLNGCDNASINRKKVYDHFHLGYGNAKTLLKRLNMINVSFDEVKEVINDCK